MDNAGCFLCGVVGQIPQCVPAGTLGFQKSMFRIECMCGAAGGWAFAAESAWVSWNKVARPPRKPTNTDDPLIEEARSAGRYAFVTTYHDGPKTPIKSSLLFRSSEDAAECARVLNEARRVKVVR